MTFEEIELLIDVDRSLGKISVPHISPEVVDKLKESGYKVQYRPWQVGICCSSWFVYWELENE